MTRAFSVARLTLASATPGTFASAFSTRRTHEAQVMPVIGRVTSFLLSTATTRSLLPRELEQLVQLADHLGVAAFPEPGRDAAVQVPLEERRLERLQGALDGVALLEHVDAIRVLVDHLADALEVALDRGQPVQQVLLARLHDRLPPPQGGGPDRV